MLPLLNNFLAQIEPVFSSPPTSMPDGNSMSTMQGMAEGVALIFEHPWAGKMPCIDVNAFSDNDEPNKETNQNTERIKKPYPTETTILAEGVKPVDESQHNNNGNDGNKVRFLPN